MPKVTSEELDYELPWFFFSLAGERDPLAYPRVSHRASRRSVGICQPDEEYLSHLDKRADQRLRIPRRTTERLEAALLC